MSLDTLPDFGGPSQLEDQHAERLTEAIERERIRREAERIGEGFDELRLRLSKGGGLQALETQMVREKSLDLITSIANIQGAE